MNDLQTVPAEPEHAHDWEWLDAYENVTVELNDSGNWLSVWLGRDMDNDYFDDLVLIDEALIEQNAKDGGDWCVSHWHESFDIIILMLKRAGMVYED